MKIAVLILAVLCLSAVVSAQQCSSFQSLAVPRPFFSSMCSIYVASSCCTASQAKRAYNWVAEDDGCGLIPANSQCSQFLTDLACSMSCAPNLVVTGKNYNNSTKPNNRMVVCKSWAIAAFNACLGYSWCLPQTSFYSDCKTLATKKVYTNSGSKSSSTVLVTQSFADTCQPVAELYDYTNTNVALGLESGAQAFVENVLGLVYHGADDSTGTICNMPRVVPYYPRSSALGKSVVSIGLISILALFVSFLL